MPRPTTLWKAAIAIFCGCAAFACGFDGLFQSPGPAAVTFLYQGDSVITVGNTVPVVVTVLAGGEPVAHPHLEVSSDNTAVLDVTAAGDSLIGVRAGPASLTIRLLSTLRSGPPPETVVALQVRP